MAQEARMVTAFSTPSGRFVWVHIPFDLRRAPITFQRLINTHLGDLLGKDAYLDDLIICSNNADSHFTSLAAVLDKLRKTELKLKLSECVFLKASLILGPYVSSGIHTESDKTEAIKKYPQPRYRENINSFLGLCGCSWPFICRFAKVASLLNQFIKKRCFLSMERLTTK